MVKRKCDICSKIFFIKPSHVKYGYGKYCSMKCTVEGRKKGRMVKCFICQKKVYKSKQSLSRSKSRKYFCGKSCQTNWRNSIYIGKYHPNFIDGKASYRTLLIRNKISQMCSLCETKDKRVLAVHHLDRNKLNNKVSNLAWLCHNCHFLVHHDKVEEARFLASRN